ncbi:MAG: hypothetical protein ISR86_09980 [Nitrospinaceae bacterium]|nr:hypothetical protein [Nitrospinaceae bacterium]
MRVFFYVFLITFVWNNTVIADEKLPDISKMSDKEFNHLPKDVMNKITVAEFSKHPLGKKVAPLMNIAISRGLGHLMYFYPMPERLIREAVKKFQHDIGQPQTGELTIGQLEELTRRSNRISDTPVEVLGLGETLDVFGEDNYVTTKGTWAIEGEQHAYPINHAKIDCLKSRGTCEAKQVNIEIPSLKHSTARYFFDHFTEVFKIISWTDTEVISQGDSKCRTTIMTINIENNEVFQITRNKGNKQCSFGIVTLPALEKPRIVRLNPGGHFSRDFWEKRKKKTDKYLNTEVQEQVKTQVKFLNSIKKDKQKN